MSRLSRIAIVCVVAGLANCAGPAKPKIHAEVNPMEKLWDEAKAHIDDLEKAKAPRADWAVHVEVPVIDIKDNQTLELVLTENQVPEPDKLRAREFFEQEYPVTYFGYVGFWALVVFERDQDRAKVVFRD